EGTLGKKLDKIIDQNKTIAKSILSLVDMVNDIQSKEKEPYIVKEKPQLVIPEPVPPEPMPRVEPKPDFSVPPPPFERVPPGPTPPRQGPPSIPPVPPRQEIPIPRLPREGPIPMPTGSFKDLKIDKPKKGLFGRFRK
ncbi:unnamed protein product, partial [marine sediment metagenome]